MGGVALYGVESSAGRLGERGGSVAVVQRGSALRSGSGERDIRFAGMARELDRQCLARVPGSRRDGIQAEADSSVHPHRAAAGQHGDAGGVDVRIFISGGDGQVGLFLCDCGGAGGQEQKQQSF